MDSRAELLVVAVDDLLARRVQEIVLPVVVQLRDARDELVARTLGLVGELARPREDRLDVLAAAAFFGPTSARNTFSCRGSADLWSAQKEKRLKRLPPW